MTTNENSEMPPLPPRIDLSDSAAPENNSTRWLRYLLAGNPFYILSAVLLLLSMRKLSLDSRILAEGTPQTLFNFASFHIYELLLVGTAIFLARRKIWYDSGLLVALENLFVFVPFILISQALMIKGPIALIFCLSGCLLVVLRTGALKRWLPSVKLDKSLILIGVVLLCINVAFPVLTQASHQESDFQMWSSRGKLLQSIEWFLIAPLLVALANFLPVIGKPTTPANDAYFAKNYFPLVTFLFWAAGTGVHFYCIDYVFAPQWNFALLVPSLWVAMWTLWKMSFKSDFVRGDFGLVLQNTLLAAPAIILGLAASKHEWGIVFALTSLNALIYFLIAAKRRDRFAFRLFLISASLILGSVPQRLMPPMHFAIQRQEILWLSAFGYVLVSTLLSRNPKAGILGAITSALFVTMLPGDVAKMINPALQMGAVFFLLHSLRWNNEEKGTATARILAAIFWLGHSLMWVGADSTVARAGVLGAAVGVLAVYFLARYVFGKWGPRIIPYAALAVSLSPLICDGGQLLRNAPSGLLILLGSFGLFALGTVAALTKSRWIPQEQIPSPVVEQKEEI